MTNNKIANYDKYYELIDNSINNTDGIVKSKLDNNEINNKIIIKINDDNSLFIKCYINVYFGYIINDVVCELQENIFKQMNSITNINISQIDIVVKDIFYK